jgi:hypothetical protein
LAETLGGVRGWCEHNRNDREHADAQRRKNNRDTRKPNVHDRIIAGDPESVNRRNCR